MSVLLETFTAYPSRLCIEFTTLVVLDTDCIGMCKSNYDADNHILLYTYLYYYFGMKDIRTMILLIDI